MKKTRESSHIIIIDISIIIISLFFCSCTIQKENNETSNDVQKLSNVSGEKYYRDIYPDTWVANDALGPIMPDYKEVGPVKKDPNARFEAKNPLWTRESYHWGESENGYFLSQDEYVVRKYISMLSDAGVDVLVMDVTNAVLYWDEWEVTFSTMEKHIC